MKNKAIILENKVNDISQKTGIRKQLKAVDKDSRGNLHEPFTRVWGRVS
jgi:hypothetical protein